MLQDLNPKKNTFIQVVKLMEYCYYYNMFECTRNKCGGVCIGGVAMSIEHVFILNS
jgi:hypothetical protein